MNQPTPAVCLGPCNCTPELTGGNRFARTLSLSRMHDGDPYEDGSREYLLDCDVAVANIARILEVSTGREVDGDGDPWSIVCDALVGYASIFDEVRHRFPEVDAWLVAEHAWEPSPSDGGES